MTPPRYALPAALPPPRPELRCCVVVPARDEEAHVEAALDAIVRSGGTALAGGAVETILFANGCRDATAERARRFAARTPTAVVHVVEGELPRDRAHVGTARAALMDAAAERLHAVGRPDGIVATTDADSVVGSAWLLETAAAFRDVDAVGGRIVVGPAELRTLPRDVVCALARDERYRYAIARVEAFRDPLAHDPWPRHGQQFGASLAVRADVYRRAGGLPAVPVLEDVAFYGALLRIDARFRHSLRVRVTTSARLDPRAVGGFGTHVGKIGAMAERGALHHVEDPALTLARIDGRALLRRLAHGGEARDAELEGVATTFASSPAELRERFRPGASFGAAFGPLEAAAEASGAFRRGAVQVDVATAALEAAAAADVAAAIAISPARRRAASGAG